MVGSKLMVVRDLLDYYRSRIAMIKLHRPPPDQGLRAFIRRRLDPSPIKFIPERRKNIFLNRYCNLSCFSCGAMGMDPPRDETTLEEIVAFLKNIKGHDPGSTFMLTGGEPTAIDHEKLMMICSLIHEHGYTTALLTNGFRLVPTDWFDYVLLDKHGINDDQIAKWEDHLKAGGHEAYEFREKAWHFDVPQAMEDNITEGARCGNWVNSITLWKDVVYPCCNIMCVAWWHGDLDRDLAGSLRDAGWNAYNPDLVETTLNWRETLPGEAYRVCMIKCWRGSSNIQWRKIT